MSDRERLRAKARRYISENVSSGHISGKSTYEAMIRIFKAGYRLGKLEAKRKKAKS